MSRHNNLDVMSTALDIARLASSAAQFIPVPYIPAATAALIQIVETVQSSKGNPALIELVQDATGIIALLSQWAANTSQHTLTPEVEESLRELVIILENTLRFAQRQMSQRSVWSTILHLSHTKELDEYRNQMKNASDLFAMRSQLGIHGKLSEIVKSIDQVAARDAMHRKEQMIELLKEKSAPGARHNSSARSNVEKCTEGTRDRVIQKILGWFKDSDNPHKMMWMYGPAGCGKTTIAQTIADILYEEGCLAASFFFGFGSAFQFVATIADQLCIAIPGLFERIVSVLQCDPGLLNSSLSKQMERLVVAPLRELSQANGESPTKYRSWLVLVDGIDECDEKYQQEILKILKDSVSNLSFPLRIFLSSRDEYVIRRACTSSPSTSELLALYDADEMDDIRAFYVFKFKSIKEKHSYLNSLREWPALEAIDILVEKAAGLFIYAHIVTELIDNSLGNPDERLQQILRSSDIAGRPADSLDMMYAHILRKIPTHAIKDVRAVMNWLIFGREKSKSMTLCDDLFDFTPRYSAILLAPLMAVINVTDSRQVTLETSDESKSLRFFHPSFPDMLQSLPRLQQHGLETFYCDALHAHAKLANLWIKYYSKHGNDHGARSESCIKGGKLIQDCRRRNHVADIFERMSTHCVASSPDGTLFSDESFISSVEDVDLTTHLLDCIDETKIWWFQIIPACNFVACLLGIQKTPQFDPATSSSCKRFVESIWRYWSKSPRSIRDNLPDILYLTSGCSKSDTVPLFHWHSHTIATKVTHSIFYHKSQRASQLVYGILIGQTLDTIRDTFFTPDGMAGPDSERYAVIADWLIQGWNLEGEGQGGKNGYLPYIKTDEIPYLLVLVLSEASPDVTIAEKLRKSVFLQDQPPERGFKRIGGLEFSYQDFNSFAIVVQTYIEKSRNTTR